MAGSDPAKRSSGKRRRAGRMAPIERHDRSDDPRLGELRGEPLADHVRQLVAAAPPLTAEQRATLAAILATPADAGEPR